MERRRIPVAAANSINEQRSGSIQSGEDRKARPAQARYLHPKRRTDLFCLPNRADWDFVRYDPILRRRLALLEQAHQFGGDVVNLGLDAALLV